MAYCKNGEVEIYYEVHGDGAPLIFLSGLSGGAWSWYRQIPYFKERYRVIVFDNRGAGRSSMPPGPYSMEDFAGDALALLEELGIDRAFVVGISMGGMIAQQLAVMAPDRVRAMVLGCTHCGRARRIAPEAWVLERLGNNQGLTPEEILDKNIPLLFGPAFREKHPEEIEEYKKVHLSMPPQPIDAFQAQVAAINTFDVCEKLSALKCPVLIITGKDDILVPPENSRVLAELIPNARLVEWENIGHAIHLENPELFNSTVDSFFKEFLDRSNG
ncbi:alpha/beta fold hydrolase [Thermodesulforhabdus norvegica]|uniref:3-oxoadipate enol-lactonase n=1 Tax=Thermodesulforhabdus norvegica TaxID=39841 RepID=A0A1I4SNE8_9BACT|nr:alpha/beta hydrolase [Thermodesulforhabdus norvegica]SFM65911.1 3-oxoadipate enol-lactonase [Thermodesulforhabdus norvegica]